MEFTTESSVLLVGAEMRTRHWTVLAPHESVPERGTQRLRTYSLAAASAVGWGRHSAVSTGAVDTWGSELHIMRVARCWNQDFTIFHTRSVHAVAVAAFPTSGDEDKRNIAE